MPIETKVDVSRRLGLLEGQVPFMTQEEFDADKEEIAALFYGDKD